MTYLKRILPVYRDLQHYNLIELVRAEDIGGGFAMDRKAIPDDAPRCADIHMKSWIFAYSHCVPIEIIEQQNVRRPAMWAKLLDNCKGIHFVMTCDDEIPFGFLIGMAERNLFMKRVVSKLMDLLRRAVWVIPKRNDIFVSW